MYNTYSREDYSRACWHLLFEFQREVFKLQHLEQEFKNNSFHEFSLSNRKRLYELRGNIQAPALILCYALAARLGEVNWIIANAVEFCSSWRFWQSKAKRYRTLHLNELQQRDIAIVVAEAARFTAVSQKECSRFIRRYFNVLREIIVDKHKAAAHIMRHWAVSDMYNMSQITTSNISSYVAWVNPEHINTYSALIRSYTGGNIL